MSREKFQDYDRARMKHIRSLLGDISQPKLAQKLGIKAEQIKSIEYGKAKMSTEIALALEEKFQFNFRWVLTGEGEPFERPKELPADPERAELLRKTSEILDSRGNYAASLAANINSFHEAISTARKLDIVMGEVAEIKKALRIMGGRTREGDPPEKKDEIIAERAISLG